MTDIKYLVSSFYEDVETFKKHVCEHSAYLAPSPQNELQNLHQKVQLILQILKLLINSGAVSNRQELIDLEKDVLNRSFIVAGQTRRTIKYANHRETSCDLHIVWLGADQDKAEELELSAVVISLKNGGDDTKSIHDEFKLTGVHQRLILNTNSNIYEARMTGVKISSSSKRPRSFKDNKVTDFKYYIQFKASLEGAYFYTNSIVLITASSQEQNGRGTIFWDSAFPGPNRKFAFEDASAIGDVEDKVEITRVCEAVHRYFLHFTERKLDNVQKSFLLQKIEEVAQEQVPKSTISYAEFVHEGLPKSAAAASDRSKKFSLWQWLDGCANLLQIPSVKEMWKNGHLAGFISRAETRLMLSGRNPGNFLVRFQGNRTEKCQKERSITPIAVDVIHEVATSTGGTMCHVSSIEGHLFRANLEKENGLHRVLTYMECNGKRVNLQRYDYMTNTSHDFQLDSLLPVSTDTFYVGEQPTISINLPDKASPQEEAKLLTVTHPTKTELLTLSPQKEIELLTRLPEKEMELLPSSLEKEMELMLRSPRDVAELLPELLPQDVTQWELWLNRGQPPLQSSPQPQSQVLLMSASQCQVPAMFPPSQGQTNLMSLPPQDRIQLMSASQCQTPVMLPPSQGQTQLMSVSQCQTNLMSLPPQGQTQLMSASQCQTPSLFPPSQGQTNLMSLPPQGQTQLMSASQCQTPSLFPLSQGQTNLMSLPPQSHTQLMSPHSQTASMSPPPQGQMDVDNEIGSCLQSSSPASLSLHGCP